MILGPSLGHLGSTVGSRPWLWIVFSLLLGCASFLSLYLAPPIKEFGFENGYTTLDAPSINEIKAQRDFFTDGKEGNPWYAALFVEPRNQNKSVHAGRQFLDLKRFYRKIKNATLRFDEDLGRNITYYDLCGPTCDLNELLFTTESMSFFGMTYPVTSLLMYKSNIGKHFYKVETDKNGDLKSSKLAMLVFMSFYQTKQVKSDLELFEKTVNEIAADFNSKDHSVTVTFYGEKATGEAVSEGMEHAFKYLGVGVILSFIALLAVLIFFSKLFNQFTSYRIGLLWFVAICVPLLSFITALALYNLFGYSITPLTIFTPFLALIHGYYTVIMLSHTWLSDSELRRDSPDEHLLEVFATCMPSIIVTSSPVIALILCLVYPIANYAAVSFLMGLIMAFVVFFSIFFFSPAMLLICPAEKFLPIPTTTNGYTKAKTILRNIENTRDAYCQYIDNSSFVKCFAIIGVLAFMIVPVYIGCTSVKGNLDYRQLLKHDSPRRYGVHLMSDVVWPTWFSVMFFVNSPPDFGNVEDYGRFKNMMYDIEQIPQKHAKETDMVWITDFCRHTDSKPSDDTLDMTRFNGFINDAIYKSWRDGVKFKFEGNETKPEITNMLHIVSFKNTKSLADKAQLFERCRAVTNKYPEFKTTPFDTEIGFADIIIQVPPVIAVIPVATFVAMFFVSSIIIGNLSVAMLNFSFVFLIYTGTLGFVSLCGITVNPFNVTFFLIIAGLAPSFTTHFCYYYQQAMRMNSKAQKANRMSEMLRKCFIPCISNIICLFVIFLPALFCHVQIFETIAITSITFCTVGTTFAFFIQVFLNALPDMFTGTHWFCSPQS